jgi:hypothetical protein
MCRGNMKTLNLLVPEGVEKVQRIDPEGAVLLAVHTVTGILTLFSSKLSADSER